MLWQRRAGSSKLLVKLPESQEGFHVRPHGHLTPALVGWLYGRDRKVASDFFVQRWNSEDVFQMHLLDTLYGITSIDFEAIHIPNGGERTAKSGAKMKRLGARAGVYDLVCGWHGGIGWLELKAANGRLQASQKQFGQWVLSIGGKCACVHSIAGAVGALVDMGASVRAEFAEIGRLTFDR